MEAAVKLPPVDVTHTGSGISVGGIAFPSRCNCYLTVVCYTIIVVVVVVVVLVLVENDKFPGRIKINHWSGLTAFSDLVLIEPTSPIFQILHLNPSIDRPRRLSFLRREGRGERHFSTRRKFDSTRLVVGE